MTAQAGRGRASAVSLKREEAEQADRPSQTKPGASQELGCLPDLTAQNNNEKTGQRIHNFEKIVKIKARGSAVYLELVQPQLHALTEELIHWWMRCRRNFSREQPLRKHSRRRQKDQSEQQFRFYASESDPRGARRPAERQVLTLKPTPRRRPPPARLLHGAGRLRVPRARAPRAVDVVRRRSRDRATY